MNTVTPLPIDAQTHAYNPATGVRIDAVANTAPEAIPAIFEQARKAQAVWAAKSFAERRRHVLKMRDYIRDNADELARIVSDGNGKTRLDALATEVLPCLLACSWYGKHAEKVLKPEIREPSSLLWVGKRSEVRYEPLGVVGIISPWNYPLSIPFGEIVMGLMAGNAIVLKVAAATPLVGKAIEKIVAAGNLPQGLFSHIVGSGGQVSSAMFENGIDKLFFTGSVPAGKQLMAQASETLTPISLELGGKDPMIVLEDADLERAANGAAWAGYQNAGQSCGGVERIYVHDSVYKRFVDLLAAKTQALKHGVPNDHCGVDLGSMTTPKQRDTVARQLAEAIADGAKIVAQSQGVGSQDGHFHPATLVTDVHHDMTLMREETFGPIIPVMSFSTEDEAVALANDCTMALTASIWTRNTARGKKLANRVRGGVVAINDHLYTHGMSDLPWGGPGESGIGRTHGPEGLIEMSKTKVVNWDWLRAKRNLWWYPQDKQSYDAIRHAMHMVAPKSPADLLKAAGKVVPVMIRKMYF
ncbi:aldehyde dehydrogenase family protein [Marinobacter zhejiangensis]|uniref:Aldehyde dehydrogenase n=1 Tax=Marinobacter zhejiangensis TaxID=488535 RepID=A0A1I4PEQ1_9GAMM|nr:aldehyde dehydrogenase family protein [Marinobacter zhejiangensis]SFM26228.1 succinate-semialdehyde dehydrogenase / glutarate-semialdehyde dehydrogenase [Marinobacter zhejiangensis]